jgi:hypothetical protein
VLPPSPRPSALLRGDRGPPSVAAARGGERWEWVAEMAGEKIRPSRECRGGCGGRQWSSEVEDRTRRQEHAVGEES